jgi:hypothetical protein
MFRGMTAQSCFDANIGEYWNPMNDQPCKRQVGLNHLMARLHFFSELWNEQNLQWHSYCLDKVSRVYGVETWRHRRIRDMGRALRSCCCPVALNLDMSWSAKGCRIWPIRDKGHEDEIEAQRGIGRSERGRCLYDDRLLDILRLHGENTVKQYGNPMSQKRELCQVLAARALYIPRGVWLHH